MSHFTCIVFSSTPDGFDELLMPFGENNEDYFQTTPVSQGTKEWISEYYQKRKETEPDLKFEDVLKEENYFMENGKICHRCNPNAIYDYYILDGLDGEFDSCLINAEYGGKRLSDYDFLAPFPEIDIDSLRDQWNTIVKIVENDADADELGWSGFFNPKYLYKRYGTLQQYLLENAMPHPYCFITPDGTLHAPGKVGWFACDDSTAESWMAYYNEWTDFLKHNDNPYVNFVDCHI